MTKSIAIAVIVIGIACWVLASGAAEQATRPATQPSSQPTPQQVADSVQIVADAFKRIHKRVAALKAEHPVLDGIADAQPQLGGDPASPRREANLDFANNATYWGKSQTPSAVDTTKPFCRIILHLWTRTGSGEDGQPTVDQTTYQVGGVAWEGYLKVWSDDPELAEAVKAVVQEELARVTVQTTTASMPAAPPSSQPASK